MNEIVQRPRLLGERFEADLLKGILSPLLRLVQRDRDLIAEIRADLLDVYCKGQRLVSVRTGIGPAYRLGSHPAFWAERTRHVSDAADVEAFCKSDVPFMKQAIAEHGAKGREIEFEQMLVRTNNLEKPGTDYIAVDRQGTVEAGSGRIDLVGVFWPGDRRGTLEPLKPALIEVKFGLTGGVENLADQVSRYYDALQADLSTFAKGLQDQLRQKVRLGLLSGLSEAARSKIDRLPVSTKSEDLRVVIALVDYTPRSERLDLDQLRRLPFAPQVDLFHLGFGMWRQRSALKVAAPTSGPGNWLDQVCRGQFDVMPDPFVWEASAKFAHLINGYEAAPEIGITDLGSFANVKAMCAGEVGCWSGTALELWLCLFYEHRRARHAGEPEDCAPGPHPLDKLCASLRRRLQTVSPGERDLLLRWIAASRRAYDRSMG